MKFRQKPPVFEAVQYTGKNSEELKALFSEEDEVVLGSDGEILLILSKRSCLTMLNKGDWLVKDDWGFVFSKSNEDFEKAYEKAE